MQESNINADNIQEALENTAFRKVVTYRCLNDILFHSRFFFKCINKRKFSVNHHHITICDALEKVLRGEITRLMINVAPRHSKTELCVRQLISHGLALSAEAKFIHLSYSDSLALDSSEEARDIVNSYEYQKLFPHVQVKKGSDSKKRWNTTAGGGVYATAAGGQVTGFGAGKFDPEEDMDSELESQLTELDNLYDEDDCSSNNIIKKYKFRGAIIMDDPLKPDEADSANARGAINKRYSTTIKNRVNSRKTPIIIVMQRLHPDDLCGHLTNIDKEEWTVISLPSIVDGPDGPIPLWEKKHTLDELRKMEADDPVTFGRQYMQRPMPREGLLFPADELQYYDEEKIDWGQVEYSFFFGDPADKGGDMFAGPIGKLIGNKVYITDAICTQNGKDFSQEFCVELILANKCNAVEVEGVSAWKFVAIDIRNAVLDRYPDCDFRIVGASQNKETRILAHSTWIIKNCIFDRNIKKNKQYLRFMEIFTAYLVNPNGAKQLDDPNDAMAGLAYHFKKYFSHVWNPK